MKSQIISQLPPGANLNRTPDAKVVTVSMTGGGVNVYLCPPNTPQLITTEAVMNNTPASKIVSVIDTYTVPAPAKDVSVSVQSDNVYRPDIIARNQ